MSLIRDADMELVEEVAERAREAKSAAQQAAADRENYMKVFVACVWDLDGYMTRQEIADVLGVPRINLNTTVYRYKKKMSGKRQDKG